MSRLNERKCQLFVVNNYKLFNLRLRLSFSLAADRYICYYVNFSLLYLDVSKHSYDGGDNDGDDDLR